jgi:hypothetical protein
VGEQNLKTAIPYTNHCTLCELCPGITPRTAPEEKPPWLSQKPQTQSTTDPPQLSGRIRPPDPKGESPCVPESTPQSQPATNSSDNSRHDPPGYSGQAEQTHPLSQNLESPKEEKNSRECKHNHENRIKTGNKLITIPNTKCYTPRKMCSPRMPSESAQQQPPPKPSDTPEHLENWTTSRKLPEPDPSPGELPARKESPRKPRK